MGRKIKMGIGRPTYRGSKTKYLIIRRTSDKVDYTVALDYLVIQMNSLSYTKSSSEASVFKHRRTAERILNALNKLQALKEIHNIRDKDSDIDPKNYEADHVIQETKTFGQEQRHVIL